MSEFYWTALEECKVTFLLHVIELASKTQGPIRISGDVVQKFGGHFEKDFDAALNTKGPATSDAVAQEWWEKTKGLVHEKVREMAALAAAFAFAEKVADAGPQVEAMKAIVQQMGDLAKNADQYDRDAGVRGRIAALHADLEAALITLRGRVGSGGKDSVEISETHLGKALGVVKPHCTITTEMKLVYCAFATATTTGTGE